MYNGYVWELTQAEKDANELVAVEDMCNNHPTNEYWRNRLEALKLKVNTTRPLEEGDLCDQNCGCLTSFDDPRTPEEKALDEWQAEVKETRFAEMYDFTPFPRNMPDINFDTIDEIPF